jgi:hypothetical protein
VFIHFASSTAYSHQKFFFQVFQNHFIHLDTPKFTFMEQMNFHKQKLYSLIIAGIAFISLLLPWLTAKGFGGSMNGFRGWGILTLAGVGAIAVITFMGDKSKEYDMNTKKIALGGFGAIVLGALIFLLTKNSAYGGGLFGSIFKPGFGIWLCLISGLAGLGWLLGLIKLPENKPPA